MSKSRVDASKPIPALPIEPLLSNSDLARVLNLAQRTIDRLKTSGKLPRPDLHIGKMPRWRPATIRAWIERGGRA